MGIDFCDLQVHNINKMHKHFKDIANILQSHLPLGSNKVKVQLKGPIQSVLVFLFTM